MDKDGQGKACVEQGEAYDGNGKAYVEQGEPFVEQGETYYEQDKAFIEQGEAWLNKVKTFWWGHPFWWFFIYQQSMLKYRTDHGEEVNDCSLDYCLSISIICLRA